MSDRLHLEMHIIQNFAPSNLNRDDVGSPKDCVFGGVRRARISSQALKRAIRQHPEFRGAVQKAGGDLGVRTRLLRTELDSRLQIVGVAEQDVRTRLIEYLITEAFQLKFSKRRPAETEYLLYLGESDVKDLAAALAESRDVIVSGTGDKALAKRLKEFVSADKKAYAADVALFGRMVADDKTMNVEAACQVAHSISTHEVVTDIDYFTAVDDLNPESETGAGMIGQVELNGSCHYRYLNVDIGGLRKNLGYNRDLTAATVDGFVAAAVLAIPTGKQNSFAAHNPPYYVKAVLRDDGQLWSLAGAYSRPVRLARDGDTGFEEESVRRLEDYFARLSDAYGLSPNAHTETLHIGSDNSASLTDLRERIRQQVDSHAASWQE